jgi:hypothetical protein
MLIILRIMLGRGLPNWNRINYFRYLAVSVVSLEETPETPIFVFRSGTFSMKIPHFNRRFLSTDSTLDHLLAFTIRFSKKSAQCTISGMVLVMNSLQTVSFTSALQKLIELLIPKLSVVFHSLSLADRFICNFGYLNLPYLPSIINVPYVIVYK